MKRSFLLLGVLWVALTSVGCAITDYEGHAGHQTASQAKLWGAEVSFISGDPTLDGTYAYTVKYDNRGGRDVNMRIHTYRNPVPSSFSRDGQIDRDGDDVQGRSGILGGKFSPQWTVTDPLPDCQFFANNIQSHGGAPPPPIAFCELAVEEIDKDLELQASFGSVDDLFSQIWSGALNGGFTLELTGVRLGGTPVALAQPFSVGAKSNGIRPMRFSIDLTQPGGQALIQSILSNTTDGAPVSIGLEFAGGMSVDLPSQFKAVFNHSALQGLL